MTRRKTIALVGGGIVAAASASAGFAVTRTPGAALAPWTRAGQYDDPRLRALSHAVLAPNPHNRQPWKVDVSRPDEVTLYVDTDRLLPHTDPFSRQIVIGLGCFLELMVMAAAAEGYRVEVDVFPDGADISALDGRRVAVARFIAGEGVFEPELFGHVMTRRSVKEPYDTARPVPDAALAALDSIARNGSVLAHTNTPEQVGALRELTAAAFEIEFRTPRTYRESVDLFRIGHREVNANPDGIDFSGPMWEALHLTRQFTREGAISPDSFPFRSGLDMVKGTARTGMAYVWLVTSANTRADQIAAGRDWLRLNLAVTAGGLSMQPMSQALQEFPEMDALYREAHERLAPGGGTVQMLGRLGYGPEVPPSPRWALEEKLV